MNPNPLVISVTGHRPDKLGGYDVPNPIYEAVVQGIYEAFLNFQPSYVITGMALGVDQWTAELCVAMQIPFIAAIPFEGQESKWPPKSKAKYHWLLQQAYQQYIICPGGYASQKMQIRNEWMMRSAHQVVAVWNGTPGGTFNCLSAAYKLNKPVYYVPLPQQILTPGTQVPIYQPPTSAPEEHKQPESAAQIIKRVISL